MHNDNPTGAEHTVMNFLFKITIFRLMASRAAPHFPTV